MVSDTAIYDSLYPKVEKALSNPNTIHKLKNYISKYFDRNSNILFSLNLSERLILHDIDKQEMFSILDLTSDEIQKILDQSKFGKIVWVLNPFTVTCVLAIMYFDKTKKNIESEMIEVFLSCFYYSVLHPKIFNFLPNRNIMDYTLFKNPNVTNNIIFKREGTIFATIKHISKVSHANYIKDLLSQKSDKMINDYASSVRTRINASLKVIMSHFLDDHRAGNYLNREEDIQTEDKFQTADNTMLSITKLANKASMNIVSHRFNQQLIKNVANTDINVHPLTLQSILNTVVDVFRTDIDKFVMTILELYVIDGGKSIHEVNTSKFVNECLYLYRSNSTKPRVTYMKETLDKWIDEGSRLNGQRFIREATIFAYRKAIYTVFVYGINKESKPS